MPSTPERPPGRPGLAIERTALAWSRSAIALVAVAATLVKLGADGGHVLIGLASGGVLLLLAASVWAAGESAGHLDGARRRRSLRVITLASLASAVLAFALVLAG